MDVLVLNKKIQIKLHGWREAFKTSKHKVKFTRDINKAPGPDMLTFAFYQNFWSTINGENRKSRKFRWSSLEEG